jgi:hypothetical protein
VNGAARQRVAGEDGHGVVLADGDEGGVAWEAVGLW